MEVHVEVDAELVQGPLDVLEHQVDTEGTEHFVAVVLGEVEDVGSLLEHRLRDVDDVAPE